MAELREPVVCEHCGAVCVVCAECLEREQAGFLAELSRLRAEKSDHDDFMAYMIGELSKFSCCHKEGDHSGTAPMMWPELIACIAKRAVKDATKKLQAKYEKLVSLVERRGFLVTEEHGLEVRLVDDDLASRRNEMAKLKAENAALRAASQPLVWSRDAPDKIGWWLARKKPGKGFPTHVAWLTESMLRLGADGHSFTSSYWSGYEFAGPLPQPQEPNE